MRTYGTILSLILSLTTLFFTPSNLLATDADQEKKTLPQKVEAKPISKPPYKKFSPHIKSNKPLKKVAFQKEVHVPRWPEDQHEMLMRRKKITPKTDKNNLFDKALVDAYEYNPQIQSKLRQYYSIAESVSQAMAGFRPSITGQAKTGYDVIENQNREDNPGSQSKNHHALSLNIVQNLYKGGGSLANLSAAQHQVRSARADFLNTSQSVLINGVKAYMGLWLSQEKLKIARISENFYQKSLEQAKAQSLVGESASSTDVAQAEFSYEMSVANRLAIETEGEIARAAYLQVTGKNPPSLLTLPDPLHQSMECPSSLPSLLAHVEKYHPEIMKAQYEYAAAKDQVDVASSALLPTLDLVGSADRSISGSQRHHRQNEASVMLRMTIPLYNDGGKDWSSVRQTSQIAEQKKQDVKVAKNHALQNAKQIWTNCQSNRLKIKHYEAAIQAGKQRVEGTRQEYLTGERSLLESLQAEADMDKLQNSLLQEIHDEIVNEYLLLSVLGELTPQSLNLEVKSWDLNTYPEEVRDQWIG
jgi:outer membrane protein